MSGFVNFTLDFCLCWTPRHTHQYRAYLVKLKFITPFTNQQALIPVGLFNAFKWKMNGCVSVGGYSWCRYYKYFWTCNPSYHTLGQLQTNKCLLVKYPCFSVTFHLSSLGIITGLTNIYLWWTFSWTLKQLCKFFCSFCSTVFVISLNPYGTFKPQ